MNVIFDFDGVVYNTPIALVNLYNEVYNDNVNVSVCRQWNLSKAKYITCNEDVEQLFENPKLYQPENIMDGAIELVNKLGKQARMATIGRASNIYNKAKNIIDPFFNDIQLIGIIKREPKNMKKEIVNMSNSIFIDDKMSNLETSNAKYKVLFDTIDAEWNIGWDGIKVTSMDELETVLIGILLQELDKKYSADDLLFEHTDGGIIQHHLYSGHNTIFTLGKAFELI